MSRLCLIYNFAQRYRTAIFTGIDREWDCEWYFGRNTTDIKGMDISLLKNANEVDNKSIKGDWYYQNGVTSLTHRKDIATYFVLGDPHCISNWIIAIKLRLFHPKKRLYFWSHGWYGKEGHFTAIVKKIFFKLSHGVFLYGHYARELMIKEGFDPNKLFVIHNSLDHAAQITLRGKITPSNIFSSHFGNDNPIIIFIGRLTKVKRLDMLIDAAKSLMDSKAKINLVFVGDGSEREYLEKLVKDHGIEDCVWFYGGCYDESTNAELIYNADLCVAPGNVGLTAMHAMVFGTPVISHNDFKWQMPEFEAIIPGKTGDFFEYGSVESLAAKIEEWLSNHPEREATRRECYAEIDNYWTPEFQMEVLKQNLKV